MKVLVRNYDLAAKIAKFHDDMLLGSEELAAFLGVSQDSIQTGRVITPPRVSGFTRKLKWRFGDVRAFIRDQSKTSTETPIVPPISAIPKIGRPTKAEQIQRDRIKQQSIKKAT
ncbi:MAG: hypothetical protein ACXWJZ_03650 [Burkholderiaceae bacterium]